MNRRKRRYDPESDDDDDDDDATAPSHGGGDDSGTENPATDSENDSESNLNDILPEVATTHMNAQLNADLAKIFEEDDDESLDTIHDPSTNTTKIVHSSVAQQKRLEDEISELLGDSSDFADEKVVVEEVQEQQQEDEEEKITRGPSSAEIIGLINVLNIVVTARLTVEDKPPYSPTHLYLMDLVRYGSSLGFRFNKSNFAAVILSAIEPACCVLIFAKGKIVCAGCKQMSDAKYAIEKVVELIRGIKAPIYSNLRIVDMRIRNMVGGVCFPHNIDTKSMRAQQPEGAPKSIAQGVRISPPNCSGSTLVYESGYISFIGTASRRDLARSLAYVYPIARRYFVGNAASSFSDDKVRRFYTNLKENFANSSQSPHAYVAVRADGTEGTVQEWVACMNIQHKIKAYKFLIDNPEQRHHAITQRTMTLITDAPPQAASKLIEQGGGSAAAARNNKALVKVHEPSRTSKALMAIQQNTETGALVNRARNSAQLIKASAQVRNETSQIMKAARKVRNVIEGQEQADQVILHGARKVAQSQKPTRVNMLSFEQARNLYKGQ